MSNMKCPYCNKEIISDLCLMFDKKDKDYTNGRQIYKCNKCGLFGNKKLWKELIKTKQALDVAVDALKWIDETYNLGMGYEAVIMEKCEISLEQIKQITGAKGVDR